MKPFYNLFIRLYPFFAKLISSKNAKAKLWIEGRKDIFSKLEAAFKGNTKTVIWMHCSSLGEFEQGRPVIEQLKQQNPNHLFLLTFFSPSGYEVRKDYKGVDYIFYLPMDSASNAIRFFEIVQPKLILFVKYEFWFYYLNEAKQRNIPLLLVSGIFRSNQIFFKWYGGFYKSMLECFTHLFVQNNESVELLKSIGFTQNVTVNGDTRFDRVIEIANNFTPIPLIEKFIGTNDVIVAGSTWTADDEELDHFANTHTEIKFIIAPHEIEAERIEECRKLYKHSILWTELDENNIDPTVNVLIINNIGMLSKLYHYATICYVGGGFGDDGIHNVLEAAVYNKPVVIGPEYDKFMEAVELVEGGGAISIDNALQLEDTLNKLLKKDGYYNNAATIAGNYVSTNAGATKIIIDYCKRIGF